MFQIPSLLNQSGGDLLTRTAGSHASNNLTTQGLTSAGTFSFGFRGPSLSATSRSVMNVESSASQQHSSPAMPLFSTNGGQMPRGGIEEEQGARDLADTNGRPLTIHTRGGLFKNLNSPERKGALKRRSSHAVSSLKQVLGGSMRRLSNRETSDLLKDYMEEEMFGEFTLPRNSYSNAFVAIVSTWQRQESLPLRERWGVIRFCAREGLFLWAIFLLIFNMSIQLVLLFNVKRFITRPSTRKVIDRYDLFEHELLAVGGSMLDLSAKTKKLICEKTVLSSPHFTMCLLVIWTMFLLKDLNDTWSIVYRLFQIPKTNQAVEIQKGKLIGCNQSMRWTVFFFIYFPKFIIAIVLWSIGMTFLSTSDGFPDLVTNVLALGCVLELDELLHAALLTDVEKFNITKFTLSEPLNHDAAMVSIGGASVFYLLGSLIFVYFYVFYYELISLTPDFFDGRVARDCEVYLSTIEQLVGKF